MESQSVEESSWNRQVVCPGSGPGRAGRSEFCSFQRFGCTGTTQTQTAPHLGLASRGTCCYEEEMREMIVSLNGQNYTDGDMTVMERFCSHSRSS